MPPRSKTGGKGSRRRAAPPALLTVRMLYGDRAGQLVQVSREEAAELCDGWQPRAELVASNPVAQRETR